MKKLVAAALAILGLISNASMANLSCETGPINRSFGDTKWLFYSCEDNKSAVVVTASGNPATPFYFFLSADGSSVTIHGEGTGSKIYTDRALSDLKKLTVANLHSLIEETKKP